MTTIIRDTQIEETSKLVEQHEYVEEYEHIEEQEHRGFIRKAGVAALGRAIDLVCNFKAKRAKGGTDSSIVYAQDAAVLVT